MKTPLFENIGGNQFKLVNKTLPQEGRICEKSSHLARKSKLGKLIFKLAQKKWGDVQVYSGDDVYDTNGAIIYVWNVEPRSKEKSYPQIPGSYDELEKQYGGKGPGDPFYNYLTSSPVIPGKASKRFYIAYNSGTKKVEYSNTYRWSSYRHIPIP